LIVHPTRDPVQIVNACSTFVGAVVAILVGAGILADVLGGVIIGIMVALGSLVQQLFVRPATVPRVPLEELAAATPPPT
jgi:hypothetical protein